MSAGPGSAFFKSRSSVQVQFSLRSCLLDWAEKTLGCVQIEQPWKEARRIVEAFNEVPGDRRVVLRSVQYCLHLWTGRQEQAI